MCTRVAYLPLTTYPEAVQDDSIPAATGWARGLHPHATSRHSPSRSRRSRHPLAGSSWTSLASFEPPTVGARPNVTGCRTSFGTQGTPART